MEMESGVGFDDGDETKGSLWALEQKLDQPMDEEAGRLRNMYREKVNPNSLSFIQTILYKLYKYLCVDELDSTIA